MKIKKHLYFIVPVTIISFYLIIGNLYQGIVYEKWLQCQQSELNSNLNPKSLESGDIEVLINEINQKEWMVNRSLCGDEPGDLVYKSIKEVNSFFKNIGFLIFYGLVRISGQRF